MFHGLVARRDTRAKKTQAKCTINRLQTNSVTMGTVVCCHGHISSWIPVVMDVSCDGCVLCECQHSVMRNSGEALFYLQYFKLLHWD